MIPSQTIHNRSVINRLHQPPCPFGQVFLSPRRPYWAVWKLSSFSHLLRLSKVTSHSFSCQRSAHLVAWCSAVCQAISLSRSIVATYPIVCLFAMSRSGGLNPASMPFFPGGIRPSDDMAGSGFGFRHPNFREDHASLSSLSLSSSDYRSVGSSPSPPTEARDALHQQQSPDQESQKRSSVIIRQAGKNLLGDNKTREPSVLGSLDTLAEGDDNQDTPGPELNGVKHSGASSFPLQHGSTECCSAPSIPMIHGSSVHSSGVMSASPVSSLDSVGHGHFNASTDSQLSFEAQLKASPMIHDILERLIRCEYSTREIQRDLSDMHHKVDLLVERSMGANSQPEFKDPFAAPNINGFSFSSPSSNGPRPSVGNVAPNQPVPSDDITMISQRLNTLTSSVGQLLALQTQHVQPSGVENRNPIIGANPQQGDVAPNQVISPPAIPNSVVLGHGLPHRPDMRPPPRPPHPPTRTWSAGTIDMPMRSSDPNIGRHDPTIRDKRRSVTGLFRRESSGVSSKWFFRQTLC